jgi:hypothetical protein
MRFGLFALVFGGALVTAQSQQRVDHVLDLLTYSVTPDNSVTANPSRIPPGGGSVSEGSQRPGSLRMTLLSMDRSDYETGDPITYEVRLENTGNRPVVLPWSPDRVLFQAPGPALPRPVEAAIFLEVLERGGSKTLTLLEPRMLFGSQAILGSLETLAPGETAWIRVPGLWHMSTREMNAIVSEPDGVVQVAAVFTVLQSPLRVRSTNRLEVSVRERRLQ